jgi:hypothetical protein
MKRLLLLCLFALFLPVLLQATVLGCRQTPTPKRFTPEDLAKLNWLEGTWRGTGDIEKPFFERYHFENETTLVTETFSDDTLKKVSETTRYELKDGVFGNSGDGARWAATAIDENSVTFEPVAKARNSFRFQRESDDSWKAILSWPATASQAAKERTYLMERWPPKAESEQAVRRESQSRPVAGPDDVPVSIVNEVTSRRWCVALRKASQTGPLIDEQTFKQAQSEECAPQLRQLKVDFAKQSLVSYGVRGDCFVRGWATITRNDRQKKYTLWVTRTFGGCRAAGSYEG